MMLSDGGGSDEADHKAANNKYSDSTPSQLEEGINHLVSLTKDTKFKSEEKNFAFDPMHKNVFGRKIIDGNI